MMILALAALFPLASAEPAGAVELKSGTLQAWDTYVEGVRSRMEERLAGAKPFLWAEESEPRLRLIQRGGIAVEPIRDSGRTSVPGGLIHDWVGAVLIPRAKAAEVLARLDAYDQYKEIYKPGVVRSRLLSRNGRSCRFSLRIVRKNGLLTNVIDADYESTNFETRPGRWWSVSHSTRVQEVEHYGRADERMLPVGLGAGYIWRLYGIMRAKDVEDGVILEMEGVILSRDIPSAIAWFVGPIVRRISRNALQTTLSQTRDAITR